MSKNIRKSVIFAVMLMGLFITTSAIVKAEEISVPASVGSNTDTSVVFVPNSQGSNDAGSPVIVPDSTGSNTAGDASVVPNSQGTNANEGGSAIIPNSQGSNSEEPATNSTPDNTNNGGNGGGGSSNGGGSSSFGGGSSVSSISSSTLQFVNGACNYLKDYLKIDGNNNAAEVTKLQTFLKNTEGFNVDINGKFDTKTFEAVKAFQAKYLVDVMGPWGVNTPTGQVWYTTKNKINEVYCKSKFNLTAEQLSQIEAYRNGITINTANTTDTTNLSTASSTEVGVNANDSQTAAAANVPFTTKVWNFIKWLFGY